MSIPCCEYETFQESLNYTLSRHKFPEILIDHKKAKRLWKKGYSGFEAFMVLTKDERKQCNDMKDAEFIASRNKKDKGDDGGGSVIAKPKVLA